MFRFRIQNKQNKGCLGKKRSKEVKGKSKVSNDSGLGWKRKENIVNN